MWAATYLLNLPPHSALNMAAPYKAFLGEEADLSCLKTIGVRTFVISRLTPGSSKIRPGRGGCVATATILRHIIYLVYNPATYKVVESRNVI